MLHAKYQDHRNSSIGDFLKLFTIYGYGGPLGHVTWTIAPSHRGVIWKLALIGQAVS